MRLVTKINTNLNLLWELQLRGLIYPLSSHLVGGVLVVFAVSEHDLVLDNTGQAGIIRAPAGASEDGPCGDGGNGRVTSVCW